MQHNEHSCDSTSHWTSVLSVAIWSGSLKASLVCILCASSGWMSLPSPNRCCVLSCWRLYVCVQDTFARARTQPSARATIGYLVYKLNVYYMSGCRAHVSWLPDRFQQAAFKQPVCHARRVWCHARHRAGCRKWFAMLNVTRFICRTAVFMLHDWLYIEINQCLKYQVEFLVATQRSSVKSGIIIVL